MFSCIQLKYFMPAAASASMRLLYPVEILQASRGVGIHATKAGGIGEQLREGADGCRYLRHPYNLDEVGIELSGDNGWLAT
jgi:hypothetical protein